MDVKVFNDIKKGINYDEDKLLCHFMNR